jgi:hypothetical protein
VDRQDCSREDVDFVYKRRARSVQDKDGGVGGCRQKVINGLAKRHTDVRGDEEMRWLVRRATLGLRAADTRTGAAQGAPCG